MENCEINDLRDISKAYRILSDIIIVQDLHLELDSRCTTDDIEEALYEISKLYSRNIKQ